MAFKTLGMTVELCMAYKLYYHAVPMTLTLMQGHSGSAKTKTQFGIIWTSKQATSITFATTVGQVLRDIDFANFYMACPSFFSSLSPSFFFFLPPPPPPPPLPE